MFTSILLILSDAADKKQRHIPSSLYMAAPPEQKPNNATTEPLRINTKGLPSGTTSSSARSGITGQRAALGADLTDGGQVTQPGPPAPAVSAVVLSVSGRESHLADVLAAANNVLRRSSGADSGAIGGGEPDRPVRGVDFVVSGKGALADDVECWPTVQHVSAARTVRARRSRRRG